MDMEKLILPKSVVHVPWGKKPLAKRVQPETGTKLTLLSQSDSIHRLLQYFFHFVTPLMTQMSMLFMFSLFSRVTANCFELYLRTCSSGFDVVSSRARANNSRLQSSPGNCRAIFLAGLILLPADKFKWKFCTFYINNKLDFFEERAARWNEKSELVTWSN